MKILSWGALCAFAVLGLALNVSAATGGAATDDEWIVGVTGMT